MGTAKEGTLVENRTGNKVPRHWRTGKRVEMAKLTWKSENKGGGKNEAAQRSLTTSGCFLGLQKKGKK